MSLKTVSKISQQQDPPPLLLVQRAQSPTCKRVSTLFIQQRHLRAARQQHPKTVRKSSGLENIDQTLVKYSLHTDPLLHFSLQLFLGAASWRLVSDFFFLLSPPPSSSFYSESLYISSYGVSPGPRHNAGVCSLGLLKPRPCASDHTQTHA